MKFDEGQWRLLPGAQAVYPVSIVEVRTEPDALVISGYSRRVQVRNDYLEGTTITARFTSPMPNVIRVQLVHFKGHRGTLPVFDLDYALTNPAADIGCDGQQAWLKAGDLSVVVPAQGEWCFAFQRAQGSRSVHPGWQDVFARPTASTSRRDRLRPGRALRPVRQKRAVD
jgi:alpha-D-xyloside xylohydrolase